MGAADDKINELMGGAPAQATTGRPLGLRSGAPGMSGVNAAMDALLQGGGEAAAPAPDNSPAFMKGLRSSFTSAGGQLHALAGQAGEVVGANDYAADQRAQSVAAQQKAAQQSDGMVKSWDEAHGLRGTFDYATGLLGSAIPSAALAVVGSKLAPGKGALSSMIGATAATAPLMAGAEYEAQQNDPEQAKRSVWDRTATGALVGGAQAAVMGAVPALVGGKLLGSAAGEAAMPVGKALATNALEGIGGNALAGYIAPALSQGGANYLNPDRDTSGDANARMEGLMSGAIVGAPFAAAGAVADTRAPGAPVPIVEGIKGALNKGAKPTTDRSPVNLDTLGEALKPENVTGDHFATDAGVHAMPTDQHAAAFEDADAKATAKAKATAETLGARDDLHPDDAAALAKIDPATPEGQVQLHDMNTNYRMKDRQTERANAAAGQLKKTFDDADEAAGVKRSDEATPPAKYTELLGGDEWSYLSDNAKDTVAKVMPRFTELAEEGKATPEMVQGLYDTLGDGATDFLTEAYGKSKGADDAKAEAYFKTIHQADTDARTTQDLFNVVRSALPDHLAGRVPDDQISQLVTNLRDLTSERGMQDKTPSEQAIYKAKLNDKLQEMFGDKFDKVNEAFAKDAIDQQGRLERENDLGAEEAPQEDNTADDTVTRFHDTKGEIGHGIDAEGVFKFDRDPNFMLEKNVHASEFGTSIDDTAHSRAERKAAIEFPTHEQGWMRAVDYAKETGMPKDKLMEMTHGEPEKYGLVTTKGNGEDTGTLSNADLDRMRFDTTRTTKRDGERNMSRLDTTLPDGRPGPILDGFKIVSTMQPKVKYSGEGAGGHERTMRMFEEGVAAIQDKLGVKFNDKELRAVEVTRGGAGKPNLTYGDLLNMRDEKLSPADRTSVKAMRKELNSLGDDPAQRAARLDLKERIAAVHDDALLPPEARAKMDGLRAEAASVRDRMEKAAADGDTEGYKALRDQRREAMDNIAALAEKHRAGRDGRFTDEMTTNERQARISEMELELEKAQQLVDRLGKRRGELSKQDEFALVSAKFKLENYPDIVEKQTEYLRSVGETAAFEASKGITSEYGGGRDTGKGITKIGDKMAERMKGLADTMSDVHRLVADGDQARALKALDEARAQAAKEDIPGGGRAQLKIYDDAIAAVKGGEEAVGSFRQQLHEDIRARGAKAPDEHTLGVTEIDPRGQIHSAIKEHGEGGAIIRRGEDGAVLPQYGGKRAVEPLDRAEAVDKKITAMEERAKTAAAKTLAQTVRMISDNIERLDGGLQERFTALMESAKRPSDISAEKLAEFVRKLPKDKNPVDADLAAHLGLAAEPKSYLARQRARVADIERSKSAADAAVKMVATSTDAKALQSDVIPLLRVKNPNENLKRVIDAHNERISELITKDVTGQAALNLQHPDVRTSNEAAGTKPMTAAEMKEVGDLVRKMMGDTVDVQGGKNMSHAGEYHPADGTAKGIIRIAVNAMNPKSTAYHESLHAFFDQMSKDPAHREALAVLTKAGNDPRVRDVLRSVFKDQPEVLKQMEGDAEERAAYMFQLHAMGHPEMMRALKAPARSVLERIADWVRGAIGIWTNNQRAVHIMDYFQKGGFGDNAGDLNAVAKALMAPGRNHLVDRLSKDLAPLKNLGAAFTTVGSARIRDMNISSFDRIVDLINPGTRGEGEDPGYVIARRVEASRMKNDFQIDMDKLGATREDIDAALGGIRMNAVDTLSAKQQDVAARITDHLEKTFQYMKAAGVDIGRLDLNKKYAPRVWDTSYIAAHETEFRAMLDKYVQGGSMKASSVDGLINKLMSNEGGEILTEGVQTPGNEFTKERVLKFVSAEDAERFLDKDALTTITRYMEQGAKRAEWARRFGATENGIINESAKLESHMARARNAQGASAKDIETMERFVAGVNGTLGEGLSPGMRKLSSNIMIYQNLRLLPLGVFSAMIDANGIMVKGGTVGEAAGAFIRGVKEIKMNFQKSGERDAAYKFAEDIGVIDSVALNHALGGSTFGMSHASPLMRKLNDALFRYNGMEQWNSSMRVSAAQAALGFIGRHADGKASPHSTRWLAELGLQPRDIVKGPDGRPLVVKQDFLDHGLSDEAATAASNKMAFAVNRWVDGAILRPDATQKPIWMNDPHYAMFGHMKQFMFAFQETTLKTVAHEMRYGNNGPLLALASYIPVMLAADMARGVIMGGGQLPEWQQNWTPEDFFERAVQRAGLFGVGQIGIDAVKSLHHGGYGVGQVGGPAVNQMTDIVAAAGGRKSFANTAVDAIPAVNFAADALAPAGKGDAPKVEQNLMD